MDGDIYAFVAPMLLSNSHPLMGVNDVFNAIFVKGNVLGDVMFYGQGAGSLPTASAVVSDVVDAVKHMGTNIMSIWCTEKLELADIKQSENRYFVRVKGAGKEDSVKSAFGEVTFVVLDDKKDETAFLTDSIKECDFDSKIAAVGEVINCIRADF